MKVQEIFLHPGNFRKSRGCGEVYSDNANKGPAFKKKLYSEFFTFWEKYCDYPLHFFIFNTFFNYYLCSKSASNELIYKYCIKSGSHYAVICVRGGGREERNYRSLLSTTLSQRENLSTNCSLPNKVLSWAELNKADSSFEQATSSNIQYPGVYRSFWTGCFLHSCFSQGLLSSDFGGFFPCYVSWKEQQILATQVGVE